MKKTVVFDFDGVIHSYTSGWKGEDVIPDAPVPKIKEAICQIRKAGYEVVVVSTRCATNKGMKAVSDYLLENGIMVDKICREKPPAIVYIDDRAICFDGKSDELLSKIENFETWYKADAKKKER
jgi:beta-phosphoglucomutase-like phosphatase (HAD superfamily)